eukprot:31518-Pelagococcus_subviridis.AAC.22
MGSSLTSAAAAAVSAKSSQHPARVRRPARPDALVLDHARGVGVVDDARERAAEHASVGLRRGDALTRADAKQSMRRQQTRALGEFRRQVDAERAVSRVHAQVHERCRGDLVVDILAYEDRRTKCPTCAAFANAAPGSLNTKCLENFVALVDWSSTTTSDARNGSPSSVLMPSSRASSSSVREIRASVAARPSASLTLGFARFEYSRS